MQILLICSYIEKKENKQEMFGFECRASTMSKDTVHDSLTSNNQNEWQAELLTFSCGHCFSEPCVYYSHKAMFIHFDIAARYKLMCLVLWACNLHASVTQEAPYCCHKHVTSWILSLLRLAWKIFQVSIRVKEKSFRSPCGIPVVAQWRS